MAIVAIVGLALWMSRTERQGLDLELRFQTGQSSVGVQDALDRSWGGTSDRTGSRFPNFTADQMIGSGGVAWGLDQIGAAVNSNRLNDDRRDGIVVRSMRGALMPEVANTARSLGVRVPADISVDSAGMVRPGTEGMSVAPTARDLVPHRRPRELPGGTGKDPVWEIDVNRLGPSLRYVPDSPRHGTIQPARSMTLETYRQALANTRSLWRRRILFVR